jgi:peroxiredoxin
MNRSAQYFAAYQQARKNMQSETPDSPADIRDEMVVALWDSVQTLQTTNAQQSHKISLLEIPGANAPVCEANDLLKRISAGIISPATKPPTTQGEK